MNQKIKDIIKKTFIFDFILWVLNVKSEIRQKKKCKLLRKYGEEALNTFNRVMVENNIPYCLAFGSLLGAVREHDFIKHDDDLDTIIFYENYNPDLVDKLKKAGFQYLYMFTVKDESLGRIDTFSYKGIPFDIYYMYPSIDKYPYCCWYVNQPGCKSREESILKFGGLFVRRVEMPIKNDFIGIDFKGMKLPVPANFEEVLSYRYGSDFMIPKNSKCETLSIVEWPEKLGEYTDYRNI